MKILLLSGICCRVMLEYTREILLPTEMNTITDVPNGLSPSDKTFEKHCVFCGQRPVDKNKEHVIPEWAIRITGDPNRECRISTLSTDPRKRNMRFAFDQLHFPACAECNSDFSKLEGQGQDIVERMLARQPVSALELSVFLSRPAEIVRLPV